MIGVGSSCGQWWWERQTLAPWTLDSMNWTDSLVREVWSLCMRDKICLNAGKDFGQWFYWRAGASQPSRSNGAIFLYIYISSTATYRNTRLLILRTLLQFYVLPHTPHARRLCVYVCMCVFRVLPLTAPGFRNSWKTDPVALEPSKQPKEVSTLIQTVGMKSSLSKTVGFE